MTSPLPFVSALCISGPEFTDEFFLPNAIESFLLQDWPADRRELVIVNHNPCLPDLAAFYHRADERGTTIHLLHTLKRPSLGYLRNLSEDAAVGDYRISWDSDDWHHPQRISSQMNACLAYPGHASFLQRRLGYSFTTDTAWIREWSHMPLHGSICHPRDGSIRYPEADREEDTSVYRDWLERAVVCNNDPMLYIQFEHGHNSWDRKHILREFDSPWGLGQWHVGQRHAAYLRSVIGRYAIPSPSSPPIPSKPPTPVRSA